jgi:pimeloyl-ACP methyl ester carboxylesterase
MMNNFKINSSISRLFLLSIFITSFFILSFSLVKAETFVSGVIEEDTVWDKLGSPYVLEESITVFQNAKLKIDPGTILKFNNGTGIFVLGGLEILGTDAEPVIFTSINDPLMPIDEETYEGEYPYAGDWDGVYFIEPQGEINISNLKLKYADSPLVFQSTTNAVLSDILIEDFNESIYVRNSNLEINNLTGADFLIFENSDVSVDGWSFEGVDGGDQYSLTLFDNSKTSVKNFNIKNTPVTVFDNSEISLEDGKISDVNTDVINIYQDSVGVLKNVKVQDVSGVGLYVFNGGEVDANNITLQNISDEAVNVFGGGKVNFLNGKISDSGDANASIVYDEGFLKIENSFLERGLASGVAIFSGGVLEIKNSLIKNFLESGVVDYSSHSVPNVVTIKNSIITENNIGLDIYNHNLISEVTLLNNYIYKNILMGVRTFIASTPVVAKGNYWGDKTGPKNNISNPEGLGDEVSEGVDFTDWCKNENCKNVTPVIIIPGITGSYLFEDEEGGKEVWLKMFSLLLDPFDFYLNKLILNQEGNQKSDKKLKTGDVFRKVGGVDIFDGLIKELENNGYVENENMFVFPYDWRRGNEYTAGLLKNKIEEVLSQTGMEKVDVLAHSMGGLVTKKYIQQYGENNINKVVFFGTPHFGAPKSFKALMYGDDMGMKIFHLFGLSNHRMKIISQNMPAVYELLPSQKYFEKHGSYVKDYRKYLGGSVVPLPGIRLFNNVKEKFLNLVEPVNLSFDSIKNFMLNDGRNPLMFPFAENLHRDIDNLVINSPVYNFVGCGSGTVGGFNLKTNVKISTPVGVLLENDYELLYVNGDGTVPLVSADGVEGANVYFAKGYGHGTLPSSFEVKKNVLNILKNEEVDFSDVISLDDAGCNIEGLSVSIHSPVNLHVYDEEGNHTGLDDEGNIEYSIEGVEFDMIGDKSFVFLPKGQNYKIEIEAYDTGYFDFYVNVLGGEGEVLEKYSWEMVPIENNNLKGEISLLDDFNPDLLLSIDKEGNGDFESSYPVFFDGFSEIEIKNEIIKNNSSGIYKPIIPFIPENIEVVKQEILENTEKLNEIFAQNIDLKKEKIGEKNVFSEKEVNIEEKTIIQENIKITASAQDSGVKVENILLFIFSGLGVGLLLYKIIKL